MISAYIRLFAAIIETPVAITAISITFTIPSASIVGRAKTMGFIHTIAIGVTLLCCGILAFAICTADLTRSTVSIPDTLRCDLLYMTHALFTHIALRTIGICSTFGFTLASINIADRSGLLTIAIAFASGLVLGHAFIVPTLHLIHTVIVVLAGLFSAATTPNTQA